MLTSADKVGGWVKKGKKHADVILVRPLAIFYELLKPKTPQ